MGNVLPQDRGRRPDRAPQPTHAEGDLRFIRQEIIDDEIVFFVTKYEGTSTLTVQVKVDIVNETIECDCGGNQHRYYKPCPPVGAVQYTLLVLRTQTDIIEKSKEIKAAKAAGEAAQKVSPAEQDTGAPKTPAKTKSKTKAGPSNEGMMSLSDVRLGTADEEGGVLTEYQPVYFDPRRTEGAVEFWLPGGPMRIIGSRQVIKDAIQLAFDTVPTNNVATPRPAQPAQPRSPPPAPPPAPRPTSTPMQTPAFVVESKEEQVAQTQDDNKWCNVEKMVEFLILRYETAYSTGKETKRAIETSTLLEGMHSLDKDNATKKYLPSHRNRNRVYEWARQERTRDGSLRESQITRALRKQRPDLQYWNSTTWNSQRGKNQADADIAATLKDLKVGVGTLHWLAPEAK